MKTHLRFHHLTVEICAEEICRFLQKRPHSSLTQILEDLCDGFDQLAGTQRLKLWTEVRSVLHRMEEKGTVQCLGGIGGNTWALVDADVQKVRAPVRSESIKVEQTAVGSERIAPANRFDGTDPLSRKQERNTT